MALRYSDFYEYAESESTKLTAKQMQFIHLLAEAAGFAKDNMDITSGKSFVLNILDKYIHQEADND